MNAITHLTGAKAFLVSGSVIVAAAAGVVVSAATSSSSHHAARSSVVVRTGGHDDGFQVSRIGLGDVTVPAPAGQRPGP
jgi:hypothetical protein